MSASVGRVRAMLVVSSVLLGLGLVAPCMTIRPSFGAYTGWVRMLDPSMTEASTYSIVSGIAQILTQDSVVLGLILLGFSVLFPIAKLATLWVGLSAIAAGQASDDAGARTLGRRALELTHHTGKFSMLDVMVIALLIVAIKGLPGGTQIAVGWGLFAFAGSVVLSMIASSQIARLEAEQ